MDTAKKTGPKDVFMQLLSIVALYFSAISLGMLFFQLINIYFPDILSYNYETQSFFDMLRWAVAVLVIVFPVYAWSLWYMERAERKIPEKRDLSVRKWLLYLTVFAAAGVIIGDLIALIFNYLQGEMTGRFILKIGAVMFIAISVFGYYLWKLRYSAQPASRVGIKIFRWAVVAIVAVVIIYGFYAAGSPTVARQKRIDERRLTDLQDIQEQIVYFWQQKNSLPVNLGLLTDSISGYTAPTDPETKLPYEYRVLGDLKFELCATFTTELATNQSDAGVVKPMSVVEPSLETFNNWRHSTGRTCFERAIDPQLYSVKKQ